MLKRTPVPMIAAAAAFACFAVSACNTVAGVGEDVEAAGETVTEAAEEAEDDMTDGQ